MIILTNHFIMPGRVTKLIIIIFLTSAINETYSFEELQGHVTKNNNDMTKLEMQLVELPAVLII